MHYDGDKLTPELLERQIAFVPRDAELIDEWNLDFSGIKGQPELTTHFATMDIAEAFLNDPYDWEGPKADPCHVDRGRHGRRADDAIAEAPGGGTPVLFADVRHYHADRDIWDLCNSGQHATWYAARSDDPAENLAKVNLYPEVFFFPAGGASVHHVAAPGDNTFARLTRHSHKYRMQVVRGEFQSFDDATNKALGEQSTAEWPHAFTKLNTSATDFISTFGANHIHAIPGDHVDELKAVCTLLDIDYQGMGDAA